MNEQRPQRFFTTEFTRIVHQNFAPGEQATLNAESGRTIGSIGERIAQWQADGLCRTIGVPVAKDDLRVKGAYREIMYALPLPEQYKTRQESSVLVVFPHAHGYDLAIAKPMKPQFGFTPQWIKNKFDAIFSPSEETYIHNGLWKPQDSEERDIKTFVDRKHSFYADYEPIPADVKYGEILAQAVQTAMKQKESTEAEVIILTDLYKYDQPDPGESRAG
jgi:hypothetical protein